MNIEGVAAVVTGGASGLGAAAAERLAQAGARVAIFDLNAPAGEAKAAKIDGLFVQTDITDSDSVAAALAEAEGAPGVARILVNCAGIAPGARVVGKDGQPHALDLFRKVIDVNLIGAFNSLSKFAARLVAAGLTDDEAGVIINTASIAAFDGQVGQTAYAASKSGVVGLTLSCARDLAQHRIRVMTIAPGVFLTPMMAGFPQPLQDSLGAQVPHPSRLGRPAEYAELVTAIIGNPMLNGETIRLDGALRMAPR